MSLVPKEVNFDNLWSKMSSTVQITLTQGSLSRNDWHERFTDVYQLCTAKPEPLDLRLYKETKMFLDNHVGELCQQIRESLRGPSSLETYCYYWKEFERGARYLDTLYGYLNNQFVKKQKHNTNDISFLVLPPSDCLMEIGQLAFDAWKHKMVAPLQTSIIPAVLDEIRKDRMGEGPVSVHVRAATQSLVSIEDRGDARSVTTLYQRTFEAKFLEITRQYYRQLSSRLVQELDCASYMKKALQLVAEENLRSCMFLHTSSHDKVTKLCEACLSDDHYEWLQSHCAGYIETEDKEALKNMYEMLLSVKGGLKMLHSLLEAHVKKIGSQEINDNKKDPTRFVEGMLAIHTRYRSLIVDVFRDDQHFTGALDRACSSIVNQTTKCPAGIIASKAPELVAKYCDILLRKSKTNPGEEEVDRRLTASITIFRYLEDKDLFQKVFSHFLSKRLIYDLSASSEAEEAMIARLRTTCGNDYTSKFQRMLNDVGVSQELNAAFALESSKAGATPDPVTSDLSFFVHVLCAGSWPIMIDKTPATILVPEELLQCISKFERYYTQDRFSGRKLVWAFQRGTCEMKLNYLPQQYLVTMGVYQATILTAFNTDLSRDYMALRDLEEITKLSPSELFKELGPLIDAQLLKCSTPFAAAEAQMDLNTKIYLNNEFTSKRLRFKVIVGTQKDASQDMARIQKSTADDRKNELQAAVVRVIKGRKAMKHSDLIREVIELVSKRFSPKIPTIKRSIEILIEKGYMERSSNVKDEYHYVA